MFVCERGGASISSASRTRGEAKSTRTICRRNRYERLALRTWVSPCRTGEEIEILPTWFARTSIAALQA
jgi:hypothetical protein